MKRDIAGAVMRLEIAGTLLFPHTDGAGFEQGKRLYEDAMMILKPPPGTASATTRKSRKSKGDGGEDEIEKARRQVG